VKNNHFKKQLNLLLTTLVLLLKVIDVQGQADKNIVSCTMHLDTLTGKQVYIVVDREPRIKGGYEALIKKISDEVIYPRKNGYSVEGKVYVGFIVTEEGLITGARVIKGIPETNVAEQYLGVIKRLEWEPGICNGDTVPTLMMMPIVVCVK